MITRLIPFLLVAHLLSAGLASAAPVEPPLEARQAGVFVLGIDGMDPVILQRLMDEGRMPHFKALADNGTFQELGTSNPPQSPVAWSNFVTGMNPGGHGIYDFIHRDPSNYIPISSATPPPSHDEPFVIEMFGFAVPLGAAEIVNNRSGTPFWDYLHDADVEVEVYRMPGNFPPTPSDAMTLSGMGTDDLRALNGKYFWYTDEFIGGTSDLKAEYTLVTPEDEDGDGFAETIRTTLKGPADAMRTDPVSEFIELEMSVHIDPELDTCWIKLGEDTNVIVDQGGWSEWVDVSFDGGLMTLTGMVRFYAKELRPGFKLYVSPINFSPAAPATDITTPGDAALELFEELGPFYTQGMPEETNAFKDGLFDDDDFIQQVQLVHEDGHEMLDLAMRRFEPGDMTFMYLSDIDLQCHMLWHHADPKTLDAPRHPARKAGDDGRWDSAIEDFYLGVDAVLGNVRETLPEETLLLVISDHGFQSYTRKLHLNAWLRDEGYLVLEGEARTGAIAAGSVDWSRTRAYALGFNGVYLNREGREGEGIVTAAEAPGLIAEITAKLEAVRDPENGNVVVLRAEAADAIYTGSRVAEAPDVVVGFDAGYGNSEQSTLGEVTELVFEDNTGGDFTGNHLMAPDVVPGVLLSNRSIPTDGSDLTDITATLLDYYGVAVPADMVGRSILSSSN